MNEELIELLREILAELKKIENHHAGRVLPSKAQQPNPASEIPHTDMSETKERKPQGKYGVPKGYYSLHELCELFGRSPTSIYQMIERGDLERPLKHGNQNIWDKAMIDNSLEYAKFCKKPKRYNRSE